MIIEDRDWDILEKDDIQRIQENPNVLFGKPTLYGTRVSVTQVLLNLALTGSVTETTQQLQKIVPTITEDDVLAAIRFTL
ncbi:hypothetical protein A946_11860, partial [Methylacidiphilum kamchatkense Kam1]